MSTAPMSQDDQSARPIGVFDSGVGGLTVLRELVARLPHEAYVYLGDTARLPYGTKSPKTIMQYAAQMARVLVHHHIKLLVVACNTATAAALPYLKELFPDLPIVGVIEPGAQAAVSVTKKNKVLLLATETTVHSGIYQAAIHSLNPKIEVYAQSCGLLVPFAEEGLVEEEITTSILKKYLEPMLQQADWPDCVILGCTHFPVFKKMMTALLGQTIHIVDSAKETAQVVFQTLQSLGLQKHKGSTTIQFLVTDLPERFHRIGKIFFGQALDSEKIQLIDAASLDQRD